MRFGKCKCGGELQGGEITNDLYITSICPRCKKTKDIATQKKYTYIHNKGRCK